MGSALAAYRPPPHNPPLGPLVGLPGASAAPPDGSPPGGPASSPGPSVVCRADLPASAWHGQLRDGALRIVWGDVAVAADMRPTPELRVRAVADLVPDRAVVGRLTALWVHTGRHVPDRVDVLVAPTSRLAPPHPLRACSQAELADEDVVRLVGVRLTTVQRTGIDLARWLPTGTAVPLVADLLGLGFDPDRASDDLRRLAGQRHVRTAQRTLALVGR